MSEKTDRVTCKVTDTTGVPVLGRAQPKIMNYISYPEIHTPQEQEQSPVSQDSLKSANYIHSLETTQFSLQSKKTAQSMDSLQSTPSLNQTVQEEYRAATKASSAHEPKSSQVTWCKSSVTINGSVPLGMQSAYKVELDRLVKEGIISI